MRIAEPVRIETGLGFPGFHSDDAFAVLEAELPAAIARFVCVPREDRGISHTDATVFVMYLADNGVDRLEAVRLEFGDVGNVQGNFDPIEGEIVNFHGSVLKAACLAADRHPS